MSDMTCREFVEMITAFLDSALDTTTETRYLDHLSRCDGCGRYAEQIQLATSLLRTLPPASRRHPGEGSSRSA